MILSHFEGGPDQFQAYELVSPFLEPCNNIPDQSTLNSVWLDGEEGPLFGRYLVREQGHTTDVWTMRLRPSFLHSP